SLHGGVEAEAGWESGFGPLLARAGVQLRPRGGAWRGVIAAGVPLGGDERTTVVLGLGVARDLD
nr:hypothetical protein [Myxococcota bacterium]